MLDLYQKDITKVIFKVAGEKAYHKILLNQIERSS
jgi:hypothetical protein